MVIAIPLIAQLLLLAFLKQKIDEADFYARQQNISKEVIGRLNWIAALLSVSAMTRAAYLASDGGDDREELAQIYRIATHKLKEEENQLPLLLTADVEQIAVWQRAKSSLSRLKTSIEEMGPGFSAQVVKTSVAQAFPLWTELYDARHEILAIENTRYQLGHEATLKERAQVRNNILFTAMAVVGLAAALLYTAVSKQLTDRLSVLAANTNRFARREELHTRLGGEDEIARLDAAFHEMVFLVRQSEERKQEFVSMISHDLRTPLASIVNALDMIGSGFYGPLNENGRKVVRRALDSSERLFRLISDLLDLEKMEAGMITPNYREFEFSRVVERSFNAVRDLADKAGVALETPSTDVRITADEDRLVQVVINLVGNALKFSPAQSAVVVALEEPDEKNIKVLIKDSGPGVPQDKQQKIFERFQQVCAEDATERGGSGLGLAICKAIVEGHRGCIGVDSVPGEGSTFWFTLPKEPLHEEPITL